MYGQKFGSVRADSIRATCIRELARPTVGHDVRAIPEVVFKAEGVSQFMGQGVPSRKIVIHTKIHLAALF